MITMILLNAGLPFFIFEIPLMLLALVGIIYIEYSVLKSVKITLKSVIIANIVTTLIGIPLANLVRLFLVRMVPFNHPLYRTIEGTFFWGDYLSEANIYLTYSIILFVDYVISVILEYPIIILISKLKFSINSIKKTLIAHLFSYAFLAVIFIIGVFLNGLFLSWDSVASIIFTVIVLGVIAAIYLEKRIKNARLKKD